MTNEQAKAVFNSALAGETNPERITRVELLREWFTNPEFRAAMSAAVARINGAA